MKHLLLFVLFSGSLDGFSQVKDTTIQKGIPTDSIPENVRKWIDVVKAAPLPEHYTTLEVKPSIYFAGVAISPVAPPDTLRATLIVYYDKGPAILHTKPGFVVRSLRTAIGSIRDYDEVYLDDKLRVVKSPLEVFSYKLKK